MAKSLVILGASFVANRGYAQHVGPGPNEKQSSSGRPAPAVAPWLTLPPTPTLPSAKRSGLAKVGNVSLFYAQFGEGPPVLLLHGGLANSEYWGNQINELSQSFTVIVTDTRGHGRSPLMSRIFSYSAFAEDVAGLLDFLQLSAVSIVGWSDGGVTALELALARPTRVSKLFAFGANTHPGGYRRSSSRLLGEYAARCRAEYARLSPNPERWPDLMNGLTPMWRTEPNFSRQKLASLSLPTVISVGEHDEIIRRDHTEQIARDIPGARLVILPDVSHFGMLQNAPQFSKAIVEFLMSSPG